MNSRRHPEDLDLQKYWQILTRYKVPGTGIFLLTVLLATIFALVSEKKYQATGKLRFIKENATSALITQNEERLGTLETFQSTATPVDTEAEVIRSAPVVEEVIEQLNLTNEEGEAIDYEDFLKNLNVKNLPGTDILAIGYQSPQPEEAKTVVDSMMEIYLRKNVTSNRTQAQAAKEFITQQLPKTEAELQAAEARVRDFQEQNNIVNLDVETELAANKAGQIDEQIDSVKVQLGKVNTQIGEIEQKLNVKSEEAIALNTINDSPAVQQILTKLNNVEDRLAQERSRFKDNNPIVINLLAEKEELEIELQKRAKNSLNLPGATNRKVFQTGDIQKQLAEELVVSEVKRQSLNKELASLQQLKTVYRQQNSLLPRRQQRYQDLLRKTEVAQASYKSLLTSLQQVQLIENQNMGNAQIVNTAVVGKYPVSTSRKLIIAGGIVTGGILYIITAFLLELRDPSYKNSKDLQQAFNYKLLTTIPNLAERKLLGLNASMAILPEHQTTEAPNSIVSEAYKMLYTNLQFLATDENIKVVTVTSSIPQEGKSTVSANLASAIAQLGQKVLLIDGDLHRPRQHSIWNLENQLGLIEVLQEKGNLAEAIQSLQINPNLDVLPAGWHQAEYLSLLRSPNMKQLIDFCSQQYDLIVIDTPPVLLFADTLTIGKNTDGIVLVGRVGVTNPAITNSAKELLEQSRQKVLGMVINGADKQAENYYKYAKTYESQAKQKSLSSAKGK